MLAWCISNRVLFETSEKNVPRREEKNQGWAEHTYSVYEEARGHSRVQNTFWKMPSSNAGDPSTASENLFPIFDAFHFFLFFCLSTAPLPSCLRF